MSLYLKESHDELQENLINAILESERASHQFLLHLETRVGKVALREFLDSFLKTQFGQNWYDNEINNMQEIF